MEFQKFFIWKKSIEYHEIGLRNERDFKNGKKEGSEIIYFPIDGSRSMGDFLYGE